MDKLIYGFIPARGGSKGVIRKNLQSVSGIPLIARSIIALKSSTYISKIFVSTDCDEIAKVAKYFGAIIIKRPKELAEDSISTDPVIEHFTNVLLDWNEIPNQIALIQTTFPFLNDKIIQKVCDNVKGDHDCAFAATEFHGFVWEKNNASDKEDQDYSLANHNYHFQNRPRRQDQPIQLLEQGSIYVFNFSSFISSKSRFCNNPKPVLITDSISLEIDSQADLISARALSLTKINNTAHINAKNLKLLVIDFDGVLTDNKVYTTSTGDEIIVNNKSDSLALRMLQKEHDVNIKILTSELSSTHLKRAEKMGLEIIQCKERKIDIFNSMIDEYCQKNGDIYKPENIYVGNDLNDMECLQASDLSCCPSDSNPKVIEISNIILSCDGGEGVIRNLYMILNFCGEEIY